MYVRLRINILKGGSTMTRTEAIELWEKDFDTDYPDMEVIIEYAEKKGFEVNDRI